MKKIFLLLVLIFAVGVGVAFAQTFHFSEPSFGTIPPVPETYPPLTPGVVPPTSIHVPPPPPKPTLTCTDLTLPQQNPPLVISKNFPYNNDSWTGGEVTKLQKFLVQAGLLTTTDFGFFGPLTEKAVQKFQDNYAIVSNTSPAYGHVGPATAAKIKEISCSSQPKEKALSVRTSPIVQAQTVAVGIESQPLGAFEITNNSGEPVLLSKLSFTAGHSSGLTSSYLTNVVITDVSGKVLAGPVDNAVKGFGDDTIVVQPGVTTLFVKGTFMPTFKDGDNIFLAVGAESDTIKGGWIPTGLNTGKSYLFSNGQAILPRMTVRRNALQVTLDPSSPSYRIVPNLTTQTVNVLRFHAAGEEMELRRVALQLADTASGSDIMKVTIWDGGTEVGEAIFTSNLRTATSIISNPDNTPVIIPKDGDKILTITAQLMGIGISQPGTSAALIKVDYDGDSQTGTEAIGRESGRTIYTTSPDTQSAGVRMFKSVPTVQKLQIPTNIASNGEKSLHRFKITADASGDVTIHKVSPVIALGIPEIKNVNLYAYTESSFSTLVSNTARSDGALLSVDIPAVSLAGIYKNTPIPITFQNSQGLPWGQVVIPAGQSRYFELRAVLSGINTQSDTLVDAQPMGDSQFSGMTEAANLASSNFIWSPNSTTSASIFHKDWTTGYGVQGLQSTGPVVPPPPPCIPPNIWNGSQCIPPVTKFAIGDKVVTTSNLNVRETPSTSARIKFTSDIGENFTISSAPINADGYVWYQVRYVVAEASLTSSGWVVQDYLQKVGSITPSITVLSPNGGEEWQIGTPHTISWRAEGVDLIDIYTAPQRDYQCGAYPCPVDQLAVSFVTIAGNVPNSGSFAWNVDSPSALYKHNLPGKQKVMICPAGTTFPSGYSKCDSSDAPFTITSTSTQSSLTLLSPNGGENITTGTSQTIKWTPTELPVAQIYLTAEAICVLTPCAAPGLGGIIAPSPAPVIATNIPNTGSFVWKAGEFSLGNSSNPKQTAPAGKYSITVSDGTKSDSSDAFFNLVSNTPQILPLTLPDGTEGKFYAMDFNSNFEGKNVDIRLVSGPLPPGLKIERLGVLCGGVITCPTGHSQLNGTPTAAGSYTFTVSDGSGAVKKTYTLVVHSSTLSSNSISASLLDAASDKAGKHSVFGPGQGAFFTAPDWHIGLNFSIASDKTIQSIEVSALTNNQAALWSTQNVNKYPLVVFENGVQKNFSYSSNLGLVKAGAHTFDLYAQKDHAPFSAGEVLIVFTDGSTMKVGIVDKQAAAKTSVQYANTIEALRAIIELLQKAGIPLNL